MDNKAQIKEWFENKLAGELELSNHYYLSLFCGIKQTERAVYTMLCVGYDSTGTKAHRRCQWIPKSCIENIENLKMYEDYNVAVTAFECAYSMSM